MLFQQHSAHLQASLLPRLTSSVALSNCRVSVIIPVRNEAENLPAVISAIANQVDSKGNRISPDSYEVLLLANNCTDRTAEVARRLSLVYPLLQLQVIEVSIPKELAHVGKARQMVMNEAYRRLSALGQERRIIASTDGDTEVAANWISALLSEFDKGVDAVGGRIITQRSQAPEISSKISLYYLRQIAHAYISNQIECFLDPQTHDCWPRHYQYYGANMAISTQMYGQIGGLPLVKQEEDVALYRRLQQADAKIRHSLAVRVFTSARQTGRATGGLSELLETLSHATRENRIVLVESPAVTEARILLRKHLRQVWSVLQGSCDFKIGHYARTTEVLSRSLGVSTSQLRQSLETSPTFGALIENLSVQQAKYIDQRAFEPMTEISVANMRLRQRLWEVRKPSEHLLSQKNQVWTELRTVLEALQQVQAIPLFSSAYQ